MNIHQKAESDRIKNVLQFLIWLMPKAMKEYRDHKRKSLKGNHRYWKMISKNEMLGIIATEAHDATRQNADIRHSRENL